MSRRGASLPSPGPANASTASSAAATSIQLCVTSSSRRRSTISATAPAGSPTTKTGRLVALCTRATIKRRWRERGHGPRRADVLHPRPDVGDERRDPQRAEYRMRQWSPGRLGGAALHHPYVSWTLKYVESWPPARRITSPIWKRTASTRGREVRRDRPVGSELPVHPGPPPRPSRPCPGRACSAGRRRRPPSSHATAGLAAVISATFGDRLDGERGLHMNQIHVTRVARQREVVAVRKQRIEGAERVVTGRVIARRGVDLESQTRRPGHVGDGVAAATADGPGADALAADVTDLAHRLEVPVEAAARAGVSHIEVVAPLVAAARRESCALSSMKRE